MITESGRPFIPSDGRAGERRYKGNTPDSRHTSRTTEERGGHGRVNGRVGIISVIFYGFTNFSRAVISADSSPSSTGIQHNGTNLPKVYLLLEVTILSDNYHM